MYFSHSTSMLCYRRQNSALRILLNQSFKKKPQTLIFLIKSLVEGKWRDGRKTQPIYRKFPPLSKHYLFNKDEDFFSNQIHHVQHTRYHRSHACKITTQIQPHKYIYSIKDEQAMFQSQSMYQMTEKHVLNNETGIKDQQI